mmetsp:Transcript_44331/g.118293  ORF Transcript_44331/g.118293 Transcript_44331/m.118293 type:complete len:216 (-) Transcript_44331:669-1316(-)
MRSKANPPTPSTPQRPVHFRLQPVVRRGRPRDIATPPLTKRAQREVEEAHAVERGAQAHHDLPREDVLGLGDARLAEADDARRARQPGHLALPRRDVVRDLVVVAGALDRHEDVLHLVGVAAPLLARVVLVHHTRVLQRRQCRSVVGRVGPPRELELLHGRVGGVEPLQRFHDLALELPPELARHHHAVGRGQAARDARVRDTFVGQALLFVEDP